ncbi:hypothetical protein AAY42_07940 [Flagellimonas eckloniae]|uniref:TonB-dependent receptor n=2 Tax=Flagellimonas eckloniae TaxID=346185 RepID=A0A0N8WFW3_9FLAO|nr:hypothetical protein AAY42_07940 [Allomuricauda eckloniae]
MGMNTNEVLSQKTVIIERDQELTVDEVFDLIMEQTDYHFIYQVDLFKDRPKIRVKKGKVRVDKLLQKSLSSSSVTLNVTDSNTIIIQPKGLPEKKRQQNILVTGSITDEQGLPLPGVTVRIKDTNTGVAADFDGNYQITVPDEAAILVFTSVGYNSKEVVVGTQRTINVQLEVAVTSLEETILVGYGKVKKEAYTGSVGVVDVENIANQGNILNIDQALQGQVAGVQVSNPSGKPGAAARVRIRGSSSILGTNQPLYVIDGVPISPSTEIPGYTSLINDINNNEAVTLESEGFNNDLGFIDFNNVESISILKDATATAIYGSRAAAGVVVITTKDGGKSKKPQFEFSITQRSNFIEKIDVLNASQYEEIYTEAIENYVNSGGAIPATDSFALGVLDGTEIDTSVDTDWLDLIGNSNTSTTNYAFNVRGAGERGSYYSALSLQNDNGAIEGDKLTRYAFALNLRQNLKDNLSFFSNISLGRIESDYALSSLYSVLNAASSIRPDETPYDEDGNLVARFGDIYNPLSSKERRITSTNFSMLTSMGLEYEPIQNLYIKTTGILQYIDNESYAFYPSYTQSGLATNGKGNLIDRKTFNPTIETTVAYDMVLGRSNLNILVGNTFLSERSETNSYYGENFPNDDTLIGLSYAGEDLSIQQAITESTLLSFFSRVLYDYDNRYLISFAGRIDGSSKFGANNRWASFPSVGIGWNIHREKLAENWSGLNFLKLRASIGQSGNVTFNPNQSFSLFGAQNGVLGVYNGDTGVVPLVIGNPDLKWEITTQKDFGLEFAVLNNKIRGEIGYYQKDTKDVLYQTELPSSSGLTSVITNLGDTQNKGYELSLNFDIVNTKYLRWNLNFNAATAKSKLIRLNTTYQDEFGGGVTLGGLYFKEGEPLGLIKGYVANGLFESQEQIDVLNENAPDGVYQGTLTSPGDIYYADLDGDGEVTYSSFNSDLPDLQTIGSIEPDFFGGINSTLNYKGMSLNVFANYSVGNDIYWAAGSNSYSYTSGNEQGNKQTYALNRWTQENPNAKYPRAVYRTSYTGGNYNNRLSSLYVFSGDYLRIKTITLGYNLPKEVLKNINFQNLYLYITGTNLFTFTKYPGADPEVSNTSSFRIPSDNNNYPVSKQLIAGIRLTF